MELEIRFLYYEGCPSHEEALERLRKVLKEESIETDIEVVKVETNEQAKKLRFPGSPTILANGHDIGTRQSFINQADAPPCPDCGCIMVRNGACYKCLNCAATSGCS
jgi:ribonucleoside-diphosphate reductase alpha chain